jgi:hypothetical protein
MLACCAMCLGRMNVAAAAGPLRRQLKLCPRVPNSLRCALFLAAPHGIVWYSHMAGSCWYSRALHLLHLNGMHAHGDNMPSLREHCVCARSSSLLYERTRQRLSRLSPLDIAPHLMTKVTTFMPYGRHLSTI